MLRSRPGGVHKISTAWDPGPHCSRIAQVAQKGAASCRMLIDGLTPPSVTLYLLAGAHRVLPFCGSRWQCTTVLPAMQSALLFKRCCTCQLEDSTSGLCHTPGTRAGSNTLVGSNPTSSAKFETGPAHLGPGFGDRPGAGPVLFPATLTRMSFAPGYPAPSPALLREGRLSLFTLSLIHI